MGWESPLPSSSDLQGAQSWSSLLAFLGAESRDRLLQPQGPNWSLRGGGAGTHLLQMCSLCGLAHRPGTGKQTSVFPAPLPFPGPLIPPPGPPPSVPSSSPICSYAWMHNFWPLPSHETISCHFTGNDPPVGWALICTPKVRTSRPLLSSHSCAGGASWGAGRADGTREGIWWW